MGNRARLCAAFDLLAKDDCPTAFDRFPDGALLPLNDSFSEPSPLAEDAC